jgi:hypothetical protein
MASTIRGRDSRSSWRRSAVSRVRSGRRLAVLRAHAALIRESRESLGRPLGTALASLGGPRRYAARRTPTLTVPNLAILNKELQTQCRGTPETVLAPDTAGAVGAGPLSVSRLTRVSAPVPPARDAPAIVCPLISMPRARRGVTRAHQDAVGPADADSKQNSSS